MAALPPRSPPRRASAGPDRRHSGFDLQFHPDSDTRPAIPRAGAFSRRFSPTHSARQTSASSAEIRSPDREFGAGCDRSRWFDLLQAHFPAVRKNLVDPAVLRLEHALPRGQHLRPCGGKSLAGNGRKLAFELLNFAFLIGHT